jgi:hypothetical protein
MNPFLDARAAWRRGPEWQALPRTLVRLGPFEKLSLPTNGP